MKWQPIESAPRNKQILIRYQKGKGRRQRPDGEWVVTQAKAIPLIKYVKMGFDFGTGEIKEQCIYYVTDGYEYFLNNGFQMEPCECVKWYDHLDRLICDTSAKKIVNLVEWWMELPEEPVIHPKNG